MRRMLTLVVLALAACGQQQQGNAPYLSLVDGDHLSTGGDAAFERIEDHARCAGFHRASSGLATESPNKADFYSAAADDAELAAVELASKRINRDLAADMVDQMARTHAARWSYLIDANARSKVVQGQAATCSDMANEQQAIIREVVKAKYGFSRP